MSDIERVKAAFCEMLKGIRQGIAEGRYTLTEEQMHEFDKGLLEFLERFDKDE